MASMLFLLLASAAVSVVTDKVELRNTKKDASEPFVEFVLERPLLNQGSNSKPVGKEIGEFGRFRNPLGDVKTFHGVGNAAVSGLAGALRGHSRGIRSRREPRGFLGPFASMQDMLQDEWPEPLFDDDGFDLSFLEMMQGMDEAFRPRGSLPVVELTEKTHTRPAATIPPERASEKPADIVDSKHMMLPVPPADDDEMQPSEQLQLSTPFTIVGHASQVVQPRSSTQLLPGDSARISTYTHLIITMTVFLAGAISLAVFRSRRIAKRREYSIAEPLISSQVDIVPIGTAHQVDVLPFDDVVDL